MLLYLFKRVSLFIVSSFFLTLIGYSIIRFDITHINLFSGVLNGWFFYIQELFKGNLGIFAERSDITNQVLNVFPATIELCSLALLLSLIIGIPLGIIAGYNHNTWIDKLISFISNIGLSIPVYWLSIVVIVFFSSYILNFLPLSTHDVSLVTNESYSFSIFKGTIDVQNISHILIPIIVLAVVPTSEVLNNTKDKTKSLIQKNFIKNANAKGLSTTKTIFRHLLKNIVIPIIPKIGNQFSTLVTFAIITETIFSWPGIGRWLLFAMEHQNLIAIQAGVLSIGIFILFINMVFDILGFFIDPLRRRENYARE